MPSKVEFYVKNPVDGFRVLRVDFPHKAELHVGFYANGELVKSTAPIASMVPPSSIDDLSDMSRLETLLQALCSYLNSGGTVEEIGCAVSALSDVADSDLLATNGWVYIQNVIPQTGMQMRHKETGESFLWLEPRADMTCGSITRIEVNVHDYPRWRAAEILQYLAHIKAEEETAGGFLTSFRESFD